MDAQAIGMTGVLGFGLLVVAGLIPDEVRGIREDKAVREPATRRDWRATLLRLWFGLLVKVNEPLFEIQLPALRLPALRRPNFPRISAYVRRYRAGAGKHRPAEGRLRFVPPRPVLVGVHAA